MSCFRHAINFSCRIAFHNWRIGCHADGAWRSCVFDGSDLFQDVDAVDLSLHHLWLGLLVVALDQLVVFSLS